MKIGGWTEYYPENCNVDKCVMISAPYTSFWDYIYTIASFWRRGDKIYVLYERPKIIGLRNYFFKKLGGINIKEVDGCGIEYSVNLLNNTDKMVLIVPTEGSRKKVDKWKTEFYIIAKTAKVPVLIGYLDYGDKIAGFGGILNMTGNIKNDLERIQKFYQNFTAKYPENYNKKIH